jgi:hypothetical protein
MTNPGARSRFRAFAPKGFTALLNWMFWLNSERRIVSCIVGVISVGSAVLLAGAGIVTQAPAQGGIAVECGELAEQLTGAGEQHGVTVDERLMGDVASER